MRALRAPDPARHPLWVDLAHRVDAIAASDGSRASSIVAAAEGLVDRRFDLLGSGPCRPLRGDGGIDWHRDFRSGLAWDPEAFHLDIVTVRGDGSDVKIPWELSRAQHLPVLGQAWHLATHVLPPARAGEVRRRCAAETVAEIDDWIARNPVGCGVNWACPMDVGIRAAAWIASIALLRTAPETGDAFLLRAARSLWRHARHLRAHLEIGADGLTSNHYLADVTGLLTIATALPEIAESDAWRRFAQAGIASNHTPEEAVRAFVHSVTYRSAASACVLKVSESESLKVREGQTVSFSVASLGNREFEGQVYHVGDVADTATRQVDVLAWVRNPGVLKPGFFAEVALETESHKGAVVVPEGAVQASERGFVVYAVDGGKARQKPVQIGLRTGDGSVEIVSGLEAGEVIVTEGSDRLADGVAVEAVGAAPPWTDAADRK